MARRRSLGINLAILALVMVVIILTHSLWMGWMGAFLVEGESPSRADLIVILAGDLYGRRILKGAELVKEGYAPYVLVSGPGGLYGLHENELAIPFAVKHGFPASWFIAFPNESHSTDEEARALRAWASTASMRVRASRPPRPIAPTVTDAPFSRRARIVLNEYVGRPQRWIS